MDLGSSMAKDLLLGTPRSAEQRNKKDPVFAFIRVLRGLLISILTAYAAGDSQPLRYSVRMN